MTCKNRTQVFTEQGTGISLLTEEESLLGHEHVKIKDPNKVPRSGRNQAYIGYNNNNSTFPEMRIVICNKSLLVADNRDNAIVEMEHLKLNILEIKISDEQVQNLEKSQQEQIDMLLLTVLPTNQY